MINTRRLSQSRLLTGRLRPTNDTTQNVFNWLDPDLSIRSGRSVEQRSPNFLTTWTPFLARCSCLPVTAFVGRRLVAISQRYSTALDAFDAESSGPPRERHLSPINAVDLLSRGPIEPSTLEPAGFHLWTAVARTTPLRIRLCTFWNSANAVDAGLPEGVSSPKWCRNWCRVHQLRP